MCNLAYSGYHSLALCLHQVLFLILLLVVLPWSVLNYVVLSFPSTVYPRVGALCQLWCDAFFPFLSSFWRFVLILFTVDSGFLFVYARDELFFLPVLCGNRVSLTISLLGLVYLGFGLRCAQSFVLSFPQELLGGTCLHESIREFSAWYRGSRKSALKTITSWVLIFALRYRSSPNIVTYGDHRWNEAGSALLRPANSKVTVHCISSSSFFFIYLSSWISLDSITFELHVSSL